MKTERLINDVTKMVASNVVKIDAESWQDYVAKKKQMKALEKETKAFEDEHFPNAKEVGEKRQLIVVNGNNQPIGKVSIYSMDIPPQPARTNWIRRIS